MSLQDLRSPVIPTAIVFGDDAIEVTYLESRNQKRNVSKMETLQIIMTPYMDRLADLKEAVCDIIDQALADLRDDRDDRFDNSAIRDRMIQAEGPE